MMRAIAAGRQGKDTILAIDVLHSTVALTVPARRRERMRSLSAILLAAMGALALLLMASAPALAASRAGKPSEHGGGKGGEAGGGGGGGTEAVPAETGVDISYPQCGTSFPTGQAFGIVGVNGGLANDSNACLGPDPSYAQSELYWASAESIGGVSGQPNASLYVNTADPGNVYNNAPIGDWPTGGEDATYGSCTTESVRLHGRTYTVGENSNACAWQYGYERASYDIGLLASAGNAINGQAPPQPVATAASGYPWWLDVETANSWQSGSEGEAMNVADLQGMVAAFKEAGAVVGVYSTESQWNQITGGTTSSAAGSLYQLPVWIPGASSLEGAVGNCALSSFTGGSAVSLTQWLTGSFDADHHC